MATYTDARGISVSLAAAFHSADPKHFRSIQKRLSEFPVVLYEGWREESSPDKSSAKEPAVLRFLMKSSGLAIDLVVTFLRFHQTGQWSSVDHSSDRFVSADMSYGEFARLWRN